MDDHAGAGGGSLASREHTEAIFNFAYVACDEAHPSFCALP